MRTLGSLLPPVIILAVITWATSASAYTGYVHGRLLFYQNQGNYCPTSGNCTGSYYPQSQYNTNNPVAHSKVYVYASPGGYLGQSTTDVNGYFSISWYSLFQPAPVVIRWKAEHMDGRFTIFDGNGANWTLWSSSFSLVNGTTSTSPQQIGSVTWGTPASPHKIANVYDGMWRTWYNGLVHSSHLTATVNNVAVRAFVDSTHPCYDTSCTDSSANIIYLGGDAAYRPLSRVAHEFGHIASYRSKTFETCMHDPDRAADCYGGHFFCGWAFMTTENRCVQFEEGLATFFGLAGFYSGGAAIQPMICYSEGACNPPDNVTDFDVEASPGSVGCTANDPRFPINITRYIWDLYDSHAETTLGSESVDVSMGDLSDTLNFYTAGAADGQTNEPWNSAITSIDDYDGRSGEDFSNNLWGAKGVLDNLQRAYNCYP